MNTPAEFEQTDKRDLLLGFYGTLALAACAAYLGFCFAVGGFTSSDTCWLLALGRKVWSAHAIPQSDPLSFTLPLAAAFGLPSPFMPRQWLFEVSLYALYLLGNLFALITAGSACMAYAFIVVPTQLCARANAPRLFSYTIIILAALTAAVRTLVRPEILTFAFMAVWLLMLQSMRLKLLANGRIAAADTIAANTAENAAEPITAITAKSTNAKTDRSTRSTKVGINLPVVATAVAIQIVWCNTHSGFILALAVLAVYAVSFIFHDIVYNAKKLSDPAKTAVVALVASSFATLVNPVGIKLWQFLPTLLFSPLTKTIVEMRHIEFADLSQIYFYPFFLLLALVAATCANACRTQGSAFWQSPTQLLAMFLVVAASFEALNCLRLMPVMALLLVAEATYLKGSKMPGETGTHPSLLIMLPWLKPSEKLVSTWWQIVPPMIAVVAALTFANRLTPLVLPQASNAWTPPMGAINFLLDAHNQPAGPIFNEAKIGAMLTWYVPRIKVFFDTRFDQYGELLLADYDNILYARANCAELLQTYGIDWVFVPQSAAIATVLAKDSGWKTIYSDDEAIIFARSK